MAGVVHCDSELANGPHWAQNIPHLWNKAKFAKNCMIERVVIIF